MSILRSQNGPRELSLNKNKKRKLKNEYLNCGSHPVRQHR